MNGHELIEALKALSDDDLEQDVVMDGEYTYLPVNSVEARNTRPMGRYIVVGS